MSTRNSRSQHSGTPFLDRQFFIFCLVFVTLTFSLALWDFVDHGLSAVAVCIPLLALAFSIYAWRRFQRPLQTLQRMEEIIFACRNGDLHRRVTDTRGLGEVGKVAWELNELLDVVETYF